MKTIFAMAFLILSGLPLAFAQDTEKADTLINELEEITVSANRWDENLSEVPIRVSKVSSSEVRFRNPQTAADLLGLSGNVFIQKSQLGGGSPVIRGFATNRVLLVVDGIRMNNAIFRSGNVQNVISLDPNAIQEAEVVFGPGAVMYGSDAIGGVMHFHTLQPEFSPGGKLLTKVNAMGRFASANKEKTGHLDIRLGLNRWSFITSVTRSDFDDLRMGSNGPEEYIRPYFIDTKNGADLLTVNDDPNVQVPTGYDQWNAMQKVSFRAGDSTTLTYAFHFSETSDYPRYDRLILEENGALANAEWYYGPQKWKLHSLTLDHRRSSLLFDKLKAIVGYQEQQESRHNRSLGSFRRTDRTERVHALSANLDFEKQLRRNTSLYYGGEFVTNSVSSVASRHDINTGDVSPASTRYPDGAQWRSSAVYVGGKFFPAPKWVLHLSSRYTSIHTEAEFDNAFFDFPFSEAKTNNKALSGSAGLIYNPASHLKIYANFSTGFRAPNVDDIGKVFDSEPGNVVVPNPRLKAEHAYNAETGFVLFSGARLKVDLAGYYTFLDNAIARAPALFNGEDSLVYDGVPSRVLSQQNISEIWVAGLQAGIDWEFARSFRLSSTFNYQRGREKDPETGRNFSPAHVAPLFGGIHIAYRNKGALIDLYSNFNGAIDYDELALSERGDSHLYAKDPDGNPYSPSWWTLNLKAQVSLSKHSYISGGLENILDKRYRMYTSGISSPGRNLIISIGATL